jgi:hypothetical protein
MGAIDGRLHASRYSTTFHLQHTCCLAAQQAPDRDFIRHLAVLCEVFVSHWRLIIAEHLLQPFSHQHADPEYPDLYPTDPRLIGSEGSAWATVFNDFNLLFKFEVPAGADGTQGRDSIFYAELNTHLTTHMSDHHLHFSGHSAPPLTMPNLDGAQSEIMNTIHAQRFESFAWTLFSTGIKPKSGFQRKISVAGVRWYEFTVAGLAKQKSLPDPVNPAGVIYFIGKPHVVILLVFFFNVHIYQARNMVRFKAHCLRAAYHMLVFLCVFSTRLR